MSVKSIGLGFYHLIYRSLSGLGLYRLKWVKKVNKHLIVALRRQQVVVNGLTLHLDRKDSLNLSVFPDYEPVETAYIKKTVRPGFVAVDIGANIGYYTTLLAKQVGEAGRVYAFEPDKENFATLKKNIEANGLKNVVAENLAVSDRAKVVSLYYSGDKGDQRTYDSKDGREFVRISATSMDEYFRNMQSRVDFIKMDIQGSEGEALLGMRELLKVNRDLILNIEFWPFGLEKSGFGVKRIFDVLKDLDLSYSDMNREQDPVPTPEQMMSLYPASTKAFTNLICIYRGQKR